MMALSKRTKTVLAAITLVFGVAASLLFVFVELPTGNEQTAGGDLIAGIDRESRTGESLNERSLSASEHNPVVQQAEWEQQGQAADLDSQNEESDQFDTTDAQAQAAPEADWKRAAHYPESDEHLGSYFSLDDAALQLLAENGDPIAQKEWGSRLALVRDRHQEGIDWLIEAASHGSQYALAELIIVHRLEGPSKDMMAAKAWARVSYMLGNWHVEISAPKLFNDPGSFEDRALIGALSALFYEELDRRHRDRTGQPISANIRPGYREMLDHFLKSDN